MKFISKGEVILKSNKKQLSLAEFKNKAKTLDLIWFCIQRKYREPKMTLVMEELFLERLTKISKRRKKVYQRVNFMYMKEIIKKWKKM